MARNCVIYAQKNCIILRFCFLLDTAVLSPPLSFLATLFILLLPFLPSFLPVHSLSLHLSSLEAILHFLLVIVPSHSSLSLSLSFFLFLSPLCILCLTINSLDWLSLSRILTLFFSLSLNDLKLAWCYWCR